MPKRYGEIMPLKTLEALEVSEMGMYFNPGNGSFRQAVRSDIYVDKTGLLKHTNRVLGTENKCIALSHARRFGKSQAAGMLKAYYSMGCDSGELFAPFEIAGERDFPVYLNKYNLIHLDISSFEGTYQDDIVSGIKRVLYDDIRGDVPDIISYEKPISTILYDVYKKTGRQMVIILDEWDCVVRNYPGKPEVVHCYLQFLHDLFKSEESKEFLALAYITGILPIKKVENESALNNFSEYTMIASDELTPYYGFTEDEVKMLCKKYGMDFSSVKEWYNGYLINGLHMYNPNSVVCAMQRGRLASYWKNTSSFKMINRLITLNYDGLKDDVMRILSGGRARVKTTTFSNDLAEIHSKDDALTALIHLGYLGYDAEHRQAYLPNYEVATAYEAALETGAWQDVARAIGSAEDLLWATIDRDAGKVAEIIEIAHETYTSVFKYNDENSLSCVLTMAYFTAPAYYTVVRELPSGKGFVDFAFIPRVGSGNKPAIIVELKVDKTAEAAIHQIKERRYEGVLKHYKGEILLVGINYDRDSKKHSCRIEAMKTGSFVQ